MTQLPSNAKNKAYLLKDNWDDWFAFETTFYLYYFDNDGKRIACGNVKIGQQAHLQALVFICHQFIADS